jgi:hypothetical protein
MTACSAKQRRYIKFAVSAQISVISYIAKIDFA